MALAETPVSYPPLRPLYRDPRPDLVADSNLWDNVLAYGGTVDKATRGLLHGLRCGGARLVLVPGGALKLDLKPLYERNGGDWDEARLKDAWVSPSMELIVKILNKAAAGLRLDRREV